MTIKILQNTYIAAGYTLSSKYTGLTIEGSASIGGTGVLATFSTTIENYGNVGTSGTNTGISLTKGGTVVNGRGGDIAAKNDVSIKGGAGTVENYGRIENFGGQAVHLYDGGKVVNGSATYIGAAIQGGGVTIEGGSGTVTNAGSITSSIYGVKLVGGGAVTNGTTADTFAFIASGNVGVYSKTLASVANFGTVIGGNHAGLVLKAGGSVINGALNDSRALIEGGGFGLYITGAAGTVSNLGAIVATLNSHTADGVILFKGGTLTNGSLSDQVASIEGYNGVDIQGVAGTVTNFGSILGTGEPPGTGPSTGTYVQAGGVYLESGGVLTNGGLTDRGALISGAYYGVQASKAATVINFGAIEGTEAVAENGSDGVGFSDGGRLVNGALTDQVALIVGYTAVSANHAATTILNFGTIEGVGVAKSGGVALADGGALTNGASGDTAALISGAYGVYLAIAATITNFGTIAGQGHYGVLGHGGAWTNGSVTDTKAVIEGATGVVASTAAGAIANFGTIHGDDAANGFAGVNLKAGGKLTNGGVSDTVATVDGYSGVLAAGGAATIANFGTINGVGLTGQSGVSMLAGGALTNGAANDAKAVIEGDTAVATSGVATVTNFGTIAGFGGVAVQFKSASDVLMVEAGSAFVGSIVGDHSELVLASGTGTMTGMLSTGQVTVSGSMAATTFTGFNTVEVGTGASFTVAGATTIAAGQSLISAGSLILSGTLNNVGTLAALGGTLTVEGAVVGVGGVDISGGIADFASTITENVTFTGATGVLELDKSLSYAGAVTGLSKTGTNSLDLRDIAFINGTTKASYKGTTTSGELTVTDGTHTAFIELEGDYTTATFTVSTDSHGGTKIVDPSGPPGPHLVPLTPLHPFIEAAAGFGASAAGLVHVTSNTWRGPPPGLSMPRGQLS